MGGHGGGGWLMTFLEIVQTACAELGLLQPDSVASSTDLQVIQLAALTNRDCQGMYRQHDWTALQTEFIINVEAPTVTVGDVTNNSALITNIPSTAGLDTTYAVSGEGQPQAQRIAEVIDATTVRCEMLSTSTEVGTEITFAKDTYDLPENDDFDRYITSTWWDRTNHWRLIGPDSPQMDQYLRSGIFATGPRIRWRQVGKKPAVWRIWPPPTASNTPDALVWEYVSKNWVKKNTDPVTYANKMTADDDEPLLDEQAVILGCKWRMWQIKGFSAEAQEMQAEYVDYVNALMARDGGIPDLFLNRRSGPFLIGMDNVQDGFWPGPGNP